MSDPSPGCREVVSYRFEVSCAVVYVLRNVTHLYLLIRICHHRYEHIEKNDHRGGVIDGEQ